MLVRSDGTWTCGAGIRIAVGLPSGWGRDRTWRLSLHLPPWLGRCVKRTGRGKQARRRSLKF